MEHLSSLTREYNDIEFAMVKPDQTCPVPLVFANYSDFSIEPWLDNDTPDNNAPEYVIEYLQICMYLINYVPEY